MMIGLDAKHRQWYDTRHWLHWRWASKARPLLANGQIGLIKQLDEGTIHRHDAQEEVERYWMGALRKAVIDGDIERGSLMAGQSVGLVNREESIADIFNNLLSGIERELVRVQQPLR